MATLRNGWRKEITELFKVLGCNYFPAQQHKVYCSLLAGKAAEYYNEFFNHHIANNVALPKDVWVPLPCALNKDELVNIMDGSKRFEWYIIMLAQGCCPELFALLDEACSYYKQLYKADKLKRELQHKGKKRKHAEDEDNQSQKKKKAKSVQQAQPCKHCGKHSHKSDDCWSLEKNKAKCGKKANMEGSNVIMMTEEAFKNVIMQLPMWNKDAKHKCQVTKEDNGKVASIADNYLAHLVKDNLEVAGNDSSAEMTDYFTLHQCGSSLYSSVLEW